MRPGDFDHLVAAAAEATGHGEFVVIGSQAILGSCEEPPEAMLESLEADIYPLHDPGGADLIDGALGDGSQFHLAFGYYAHGVGPETAVAPRGWQERLVRRDIPPRGKSGRPIVAWCLEAHDLVLAKCAAGRERDRDYAKQALEARLVEADELLARAAQLPLTEERRPHVEETLRGIIASSTPPPGAD